MLGIPLSAPGGDLSKWFIPTYVGHTALAGWLHRPWRFIPTYVGHTSCPAPVCCRFAVHPHIRGAYPGGNHAFLRAFGSSPHTWGILNPFRRILAAHRFIPTYVGHTNKPKTNVLVDSVHPHIRGAYRSVSSLCFFESGSSPHTWGILKCFIYLKVYKSVHPHIRGAYSDFTCLRGAKHGSSPHTWGIRNAPDMRMTVNRFIPTYVGHTGTGRTIWR